MSLYLMILRARVGIVEEWIQLGMRIAREPAQILVEYQAEIKESPSDMRTKRFIEATVDTEMQMEFE